MRAEGFAPGKLILSGEHAVVYGHLGLAVAIDRGIRVTLETRPGPTRAEGADEPLRRALAAVLPESGLEVGISSDLPAGRGMGSSAALSIALLRAWSSLRGESWGFDELHRRGFALEREFHGSPSGLDHAVSILGGGVGYRRVGRSPSLRPLPLPALPMVVMDTGRPGRTAELVAAVRERASENREVLGRIGSLTEALSEDLEQGASLDKIGGKLHRNHRLLQELGVSTADLDQLVDAAVEAGAQGAKLSGAGGGGVAIALAREPAPVIEAVAELGFKAFHVKPHKGGS